MSIKYFSVFFVLLSAFPFQGIVRAESAKITGVELLERVKQNLQRVEEFEFIKKAAQEMGVRVWMFGGTASAYIHYSKWDLMREKKILELQPDRFDYDFTNIFRSTQDLDIVIDGKVEQIKMLRDLLVARYPYFIGTLKAWEVRPLRFAIGSPDRDFYKEALLNDPNFSNQNSDTHSLAMVEISESKEPVVRDLRAWNGGESQFLIDALNGTITYIRNPMHQTTARARLGQNPEILSVLRLLVKAFQFNLTINFDSIKDIREIVKNFDPVNLTNSTALRKINETASKLIMHSNNIEYSMNILDSLGLREKLLMLNLTPTAVYDAKYWLTKEPLRSYGPDEKPKYTSGKLMLRSFQPTGRTAKSLGLEVVSHETNDMLADESIRRAHTGEPNIIISRANVASESANLGDGFYTLKGTKGGRGNGLTIRMKVDPEAREGVDFIYIDNVQVAIFFNKRVLTVLQESLNYTLPEFINFLISSDIKTEDLGKYERHFRRINLKSMSGVSSNDIRVVKDTILSGNLSHSQYSILGRFLGRANLLAAKLIYDEKDEFDFDVFFKLRETIHRSGNGFFKSFPLKVSDSEIERFRIAIYEYKNDLNKKSEIQYFLSKFPEAVFKLIVNLKGEIDFDMLLIFEPYLNSIGDDFAERLESSIADHEIQKFKSYLKLKKSVVTTYTSLLSFIGLSKKLTSRLFTNSDGTLDFSMVMIFKDGFFGRSIKMFEDIGFKVSPKDFPFVKEALYQKELSVEQKEILLNLVVKSGEFSRILIHPDGTFDFSVFTAMNEVIGKKESTELFDIGKDDVEKINFDSTHLAQFLTELMNQDRLSNATYQNVARFVLKAVQLSRLIESKSFAAVQAALLFVTKYQLSKSNVELQNAVFRSLKADHIEALLLANNQVKIAAQWPLLLENSSVQISEMLRKRPSLWLELSRHLASDYLHNTILNAMQNGVQVPPYILRAMLVEKRKLNVASYNEFLRNIVHGLVFSPKYETVFLESARLILTTEIHESDDWAVAFQNPKIAKDRAIIAFLIAEIQRVANWQSDRLEIILGKALIGLRDHEFALSTLSNASRPLLKTLETLMNNQNFFQDPRFVDQMTRNKDYASTMFELIAAYPNYKNREAYLIRLAQLTNDMKHKAIVAGFEKSADIEASTLTEFLARLDSIKANDLTPEKAQSELSRFAALGKLNPSYILHTDFIDQLLNRTFRYPQLAQLIFQGVTQYILKQELWVQHPDTLVSFIEKINAMKGEAFVIEHLISQKSIFQISKVQEILTHVLVKEFREATAPNVYTYYANVPALRSAIQFVFSQPFAIFHPQYKEILLRNNPFQQTTVSGREPMVDQQGLVNQTALVEKLMQKTELHSSLFYLFGRDGWQDRDFVERMIRRMNWDAFFQEKSAFEGYRLLVEISKNKNLLAIPSVRNNFLKIIGAYDHVYGNDLTQRRLNAYVIEAVKSIISGKILTEFPEVFEILLRNGSYFSGKEGFAPAISENEFNELILRSPWKDNPRLKAFCNGRPLTLENLVNAMTYASLFKRNDGGIFNQKRIRNSRSEQSRRCITIFKSKVAL